VQPDGKIKVVDCATVKHPHTRTHTDKEKEKEKGKGEKKMVTRPRTHADGTPYMVKKDSTCVYKGWCVCVCVCFGVCVCMGYVYFMHFFLLLITHSLTHTHTHTHTHTPTGGVDWTIYSVYKIDCGCSLPSEMADGNTHKLQLMNTKGKVQVAGVVIW
jgi:hypothetical protein